MPGSAVVMAARSPSADSIAGLCSCTMIHTAFDWNLHLCDAEVVLLCTELVKTCNVKTSHLQEIARHLYDFVGGQQDVLLQRYGVANDVLDVFCRLRCRLAVPDEPICVLVCHLCATQILALDDANSSVKCC